MRNRFGWAAALTAIAAIVVAPVALGKVTKTKVILGNLVLEIEAGISPEALPKNTLAPISFRLGTKISTKDGKHPPAAKTFEGYVDESGALNPKGLAVCKPGQLEARTTAAAEKACNAAKIGKGFATAEVEFPESLPFDAKGPLLVFNGGQKGNKTLVLVHVYANVPAPTAFVTKVYVTKVNKGRYGLKIDAKIPTVAGGAGSLIDFGITNKRFFTYKGKKQSYFLAKCPTGHLRGEGSASFSDGTTLKGAVVLPCKSKG